MCACSLAEFAPEGANKFGHDFRGRVPRKSFFSACKRASTLGVPTRIQRSESRGERRNREPFELCRLRQRETWFASSDEVRCSRLHLFRLKGMAFQTTNIKPLCRTSGPPASPRTHSPCPAPSPPHRWRRRRGPSPPGPALPPAPRCRPAPRRSCRW